MRSLVYFDNAATSFPKPKSVISEVKRCISRYCANPGRSTHRIALEAAEKVFSDCSIDGFAFDFEVILRAQKHGFKMAEMPVKVVNHRESSVRPLRDSFKMLGDIKRIKKQIKAEKTL